MTRFARFGQGQKPAHDGTKWSEMKSGGAQGSEGNPGNDQQSTDKPTALNGVKKDTHFKQDNKKNKFQKKFGGGGKRDFSKMECHNCHKVGHKVADCPEPSDGKQQEVQCYNCKGKGHKAFQCPKGPSDRRNHNKTYGGFDKSKKIDWKAQRSAPDWKEKRSEHRRVKRQDDTSNKMHCFNCREPGHRLSDCPELQKDVEHGTDICFKCGSTEHKSRQCRIKLPAGEYPFAKCFICGESGHISQKCLDNPRGLYPNGGCCNECGSVEHLRRDCPEYQKQQGIESITLDRIEEVNSADQDVTIETDSDQQQQQVVKTNKKKTPKIVKF